MRISQIEQTDLVLEYIPPEELSAIVTLFETEDTERLTEPAKKVAKAFGISGWDALWQKKPSTAREMLEKKLTASFHNNLILLVQKTWVEKADETFKEQVLYKISRFCEDSPDIDYKTRYATFSETVRDAVFLMFGSQARQKDFALYALRIDPLFGLFWWFIDTVENAIQQDVFWDEEKYRIFLLLGMSFISNY